MSEKVEINSLNELIAFKDELIKNPQNGVEISAINGVIYTIKLSGGRFKNYDINYISADIAKIILEYQAKYDEFIDGIEKEFNIKLLSSSKELKFKLENGSVEISSDFVSQIILEGISKMQSEHLMIVFLAAICAWFAKQAYSKKVDADIEKLRIQREKENDQNNMELLDKTIEAMEKISISKELQTSANSFKRAVASTLQDDESASLNPSINKDSHITSKDTKSFRNKDLVLEDIEEITDIEDTIETQNFLKDGKPVKLKESKIEVNTTAFLSAEKRVGLIKEANAKNSISLKVKLIKDAKTLKVKEAYIMDILGDENE